ncbi:MAG: DUF397 domain-containing protein [Pseudonocardiaceae bacterium]
MALRILSSKDRHDGCRGNPELRQPSPSRLSKLIGEVDMQQVTNGVPEPRLRGVIWRKSRYSNPYGNCVELAELPDAAIAVRNSRHPGGPALIYPHAELAVFIRGVKDGQFDGPLG